MPIIPPRALLNPVERLRRVGVDSRLQLVEFQPFHGWLGIPQVSNVSTYGTN